MEMHAKVVGKFMIGEYRLKAVTGAKTTGRSSEEGVKVSPPDPANFTRYQHRRRAAAESIGPQVSKGRQSVLWIDTGSSRPAGRSVVHEDKVFASCRLR